MRILLTALLSLFAVISYAVDDLTAAQRIAGAGVKVQNARLKTIAQNIANAQATSREPGGDPYRRQIVTLRTEYDPDLDTNVVTIDKVITDKSQFDYKYEPYHPAADQDGYVKYPNVHFVVENVDAKEAQRSLEANLSSLEISRSTQLKLIDSLNR
jgi:flagellar basal-body rod protein FlgC